MRVDSVETWQNSDWARENGMIADNGGTGPGPGIAVTVAALSSCNAGGKGVPSNSQRKLPLEGLMAADFSNIIAGPFAGRMLAEFGATVVRVENPAPYQYFAEPFHLLFNYGKSSVTIDLQSATGRENLKKFIAYNRPAMVIQNFRAGVAERLGIGFNELEQALPGLVYLHINAFGNAGPWESYTGFEQTVQAICGIQEAYSTKEHPELFPYPVTDMMTGLLGSFAVLAAYYRRLRDNSGRAVVTSLAQAGTLLGSCTMQTPFGATGRRFSGLFRAKDGWIAVTAEKASDVMRFDGGGLPEGNLIALRKAFKKRNKAYWQNQVKEAGTSSVVVSLCPSQKALKEFRKKKSNLLVAAHTFPPYGTLLITGSPVRSAQTGMVKPGKAVERGTDTRRLFEQAGIEMEKPGSRSVVPLFSKRKSIFAFIGTIKWVIYYLIINRK